MTTQDKRLGEALHLIAEGLDKARDIALNGNTTLIASMGRVERAQKALAAEVEALRAENTRALGSIQEGINRLLELGKDRDESLEDLTAKASAAESAIAAIRARLGLNGHAST